MNSPDQLGRLFGGIPFIDDGFRFNAIVSAVALKRASLLADGRSITSELLSPSVARRIYAFRSEALNLSIPLNQLPSKQADRVSWANRTILRAMPEWEQLFALPIEYFALDDARVSATCSLIPQSVFLGTRAFHTEDTLLETVLHETAHTSLNLLREISNFEVREHEEVYTLPSGAAGKSPSGVLLAAHFALTVSKYCLKLPEKNARNRAQYLLNYSKLCIESLSFSSALSELGQFVHHRLDSCLSHLEVVE